MDPSRKRNFDGGEDRGSHRGHLDRSGVNGTRNWEGQNHGNGARFGGGRGGHYGGRYGNNGIGEGAQGGNCNNTKQTTMTGRKWGATVRNFGKEVGRRRENNWLGVWGKDICETIPLRHSYWGHAIGAHRIFVRPCHRGAHSKAMPSSAYSKATPSSAYYDQPRS